MQLVHLRLHWGHENTSPLVEKPCIPTIWDDRDLATCNAFVKRCKLVNLYLTCRKSLGKCNGDKYLQISRVSTQQL